MFIKILQKMLKQDFQQLKTIRSFSECVINGKTTTDKTDQDQNNLLEILMDFNDKSRPRKEEGQMKKRNTLDSVNGLFESRELALSAFKNGIFPLKPSQGKELKTIAPKQRF